MLPADAEFANIKKEFAEISAPSDDHAAYESFLARNRNFVLLCQNNPLIAKLQLPQLLTAMTCTQPRRYSIASSPLTRPKSFGVCVGVVRHTENVDSTMQDWEGLASGFLKRCEPGNTLWVRMRPSQAAFHLPDDESVPVIMIAAGTGIAPFLGFMVVHCIYFVGFFRAEMPTGTPPRSGS